MGNYLMSTCDDGHEQVAFTSHYCPMCLLFEQIDDLKNECNRLQDQIDRQPLGE